MYFINTLKSLSSLVKILARKKIIVFGAGGSGIDISSALLLMSLDIAYFVDNNANRWDTQFSGKNIKSPQELLNETKTNTSIIVASVFYKEISEQLTGMGFEENLHFFNGLFGEAIPERYGFSIGKHTYGYQQFCYHGVPLESIGKFCSIADNVDLSCNYFSASRLTNHPMLTTNQQYIERNNKITIGHDVWIGGNVTITSSVRIGNGVVIGAGTIIKEDVADYSIIAGNPPRILRYRFPEEQIKVLNRVQWWNWPDEKIKENLACFVDPDRFFTVFG